MNGLRPKKKALDKYAYLFDPPTCVDRSYASYLLESLSRPVERHYFLTEKLVEVVSAS